MQSKESVPEFEKHPLQSKWTFWYDPPKSYKSSTWRMISQEVEDFWALWNNAKGPHELPAGCNYYYFKKGIEPKWEDAANSHGGRWLMFLKPNIAEEELTELWLRVVLALIGNTIDQNDDICGAAFTRKSDNKIAVWTKDSSPELTLMIGQKLKEVLQFSDRLVYQTHQAAKEYKKGFLYEFY